MKLSKETISVIQNFATINQGIEFKPGNRLSTVSPNKTILAQATIQDEFSKEFRVHDLTEFLGSYNFLQDKGVELSFVDGDDENVYFKHNRGKLTYRTTAKGVIVTPPEKTLKIENPDCSFTLSAEDLAELIKSAKILTLPHIAVVSDGETVDVQVSDQKNDGRHNYSINVGSGNGRQYKIVFKEENLKMVPGSYEVQISFRGFAHFKNTNQAIEYWIAFESTESTF